MAENNPDLIPLPSIGESKASLDASVKTPEPRRSKLWLVVLACIVAGIGLGVFVYQKSIAPVAPPQPTVTPKPAAASPLPSPSPVTPAINEITPVSNNIVFPKAGEVRVYFGGYSSATFPGHLIRLTGPSGQSDLILPANVAAGDKMAIMDSGLEVTAGQTIKIESFDGGNESRPSFGWIKPDATNQCGATVKVDATPLITFATQKAAGQPLVSSQCWADWGPEGDTSRGDFNDFFIIMSYVPVSQASASPSTQASASPTASPSVKPSVSPSPSPSVKASVSPSPSAKASASVAASPRVTMPEGSALPEAGIFEVTMGTVGVGMILVLLGLLGLLLI